MRWEPRCPWIQALTNDCLEAADTREKRVPSWKLLGLKVTSQCSWLSSSSGSDITIIAVQKTISNPDICPTCCISQLSLANAAPETLNMEIKTKRFNNHGSSLAKRKPTGGTKLLSADRPVGWLTWCSRWAGRRWPRSKVLMTACPPPFPCGARLLPCTLPQQRSLPGVLCVVWGLLR